MDAAETAGTKAPAGKAAPASTTAKAKSSPKSVTPGRPTASTKAVPTPGSPSAKATSSATTAKSAAGGGTPKTSPSGPSGPTYRPPSGATRSAARRPPPPPRRKKHRVTRKTVGAIVALALVASLVVFFAIAVNGSSTNTQTINATLSGPEQVEVPSGSVLGAVDTSRYPTTIDGIKCEASEQVVYHIHAHLTIFVNGHPRVVPYGIGIAPPLQYNNTSSGTFVNGGTCFYWLHTHAADGIMHIESPTQTTYSLGQFFDMWGQPLSSTQVGSNKGPVTVYVDGKVYTGDPRLIPLATHSQIQLDLGSPSPAPVNITFPSGL
jgi:hypothetical protein